MDIGEKIAALRKKANLTQEELADVLNVTRQSVSRWEAGEAYPDMNKIGKLADILGTNCDYLLRNDVTSEGEKIKVVTETSRVEKYIDRLILTIISFLPFIGVVVGIFAIKKEEKSSDNLLRKLMIVGIVFSALVSIFIIAFVISALISVAI